MNENETAVAKVNFLAEEAIFQRNFLKLMVGLEIICISQKDLEDIYEAMALEKVPYHNRIVLHNKEEKDRFILAMNAFFPDRFYEITNAEDEIIATSQFEKAES